MPKYLITLFLLVNGNANAQPAFRVIAFFTAKNDVAHITFVREANDWFQDCAQKHNFTYDTTSDWSNMNRHVLSRYEVVIFLDTRPDAVPHRKAFKRYMKKGGAWMGFHFSAFAL